MGIAADISGRPKHFYSIYQKLQRGKEFAEIYDLIAIRIVVDSVKDCYGAVGIVHSIWTPLPGRFKDYIAMPKTNGYQSHPHDGHRARRRSDSRSRSARARCTARASTVSPRTGATKKAAARDDFDQKLAWLRSLLEWQEDMRDSREFMEHLKLDLFDNQVFVFTPKGDVMGLSGGRDAARLRVPRPHLGRPPLRRREGERQDRAAGLQRCSNGDICEVLVNKSSRRPVAGLADDLQDLERQAQDQAVVPQEPARREHHGWARRAGARDRAQPARRRSRRRHSSARSPPRSTARRSTTCMRASASATSRCVDRRQAAGGSANGKTSCRCRWTGRPSAGRRKIAQRAASGVSVRGADDVLVRFAKCCTPVPGDPIVGFISQGKGVSVHRVDCPNVAAHRAPQPERLIDVSVGYRADRFAPGRRRGRSARPARLAARHHGRALRAEDQRDVGHCAGQARPHGHDLVQPRDPRSQPSEPHPREDQPGARRSHRVSRDQARSAREQLTLKARPCELSSNASAAPRWQSMARSRGRLKMGS